MQDRKNKKEKRLFPNGKSTPKVTYNVQCRLMRDASLRSTRCNTQGDLREE